MKGFITLLSLFCILVSIIIPCKHYIDSLGYLLIAFTFSYTFIGIATGFINTLSSTIANAFPLIFFYCFGRYIQNKLQTKTQFLFFISILITFYSFEIYSSIIQSIISSGNIINTSRQFRFGSDESRALTATLVGLCVSIGFIGLPISLILKNNKKLKWYYFLIFFFSTLTTIHLVNRTGLIVGITSLIVTLAYYYREKRFKIILAIFLCATLFFILLKTGVINQDIIDAYANRNNDDLLTGGGRLDRWEEVPERLIFSPFGWAEKNGHTVYYIHNMWLDIAKVTGIIPCLLLIISTIKSIKSIIQLTSIRQNIIVATFVALNVCFFLSCFVEPVYGGLHLFLYVMVWGMQNQYLKHPNLL